MGDLREEPRGPVAPLFWVKKKEEMTEGKKSRRASKSGKTAPSPSAQGLDLPLTSSCTSVLSPCEVSYWRGPCWDWWGTFFCPERKGHTRIFLYGCHMQIMMFFVLSLHTSEQIMARTFNIGFQGPKVWNSFDKNIKKMLRSCIKVMKVKLRKNSKGITEHSTPIRSTGNL